MVDDNKKESTSGISEIALWCSSFRPENHDADDVIDCIWSDPEKNFAKLLESSLLIIMNKLSKSDIRNFRLVCKSFYVCFRNSWVIASMHRRRHRMEHLRRPSSPHEDNSSDDGPAVRSVAANRPWVDPENNDDEDFPATDEQLEGEAAQDERWKRHYLA